MAGTGSDLQGRGASPAGRRRGPGKRELNKAGNRAAIVAAARRVFAEFGYDAATVRDVIGATDLAAGTFYNYFRDKESVLRALLGESVEEMRRRTAEARRDARTADEMVAATIDVSFAMLAGDRGLFDLLRRNAGTLRAVLHEPVFLAGLDDLRRDLESALAREGRGVVDVEFLTAAISGVAYEVAAAAVDRGPSGMKAAAAFATSLVLGGIAGVSATSPVPGIEASGAQAGAPRRRTR